jgi:tRNA wybutosine-synthesizing protein 2
MPRLPSVNLERTEAERSLRILLRARAVNKEFHIRTIGNHVFIPVIPQNLPEGYKTVTKEFNPRTVTESLTHKIRKRLSEAGNGEVWVPKKWIRYGDSIILKQPPEGGIEKEIAGLILEESGSKAVYVDMSQVSGQMRKPDIRLIAGVGHDVIHRENGVRYTFDPSRVMFSPGNVNVRGTIARMDLKGKTILDMFSGIGYFAIPAAKFSGCSGVYCSEINPESYEYLKKNIALNSVGGIVKTKNEDCRKAWGEVMADLIIMGHFDSLQYLDSALPRTKPKSRIIMHVICRTGQSDKKVSEIIGKADDLGYSIELENKITVKSYSPHQWHIQLTFAVISSAVGKSIKN